MTAPLRMWRFEDAPEEFRALSRHGGDEDWVVHIPAELVDAFLPWCEPGYEGQFYSLAPCSISDHPQPDGSTVRIAAHA